MACLPKPGLNRMRIPSSGPLSTVNDTFISWVTCVISSASGRTSIASAKSRFAACHMTTWPTWRDDWRMASGSPIYRTSMFHQASEASASATKGSAERGHVAERARRNACGVDTRGLTNA